MAFWLEALFAVIKLYNKFIANQLNHPNTVRTRLIMRSYSLLKGAY